MSRLCLSVLLFSILNVAPLHAVTMDVNEGTNIDTTDDTPGSNDLGVFAMAGNPPTFLMNVGSGLKADYFGGTAYADLDCTHLSGLSFSFGNFLPDPGAIFFVQDGARYAKVRFNSVVENSHINLTWDALGTCAVDPPPVSSFTFTTYDQIAWFHDTSTNSPSDWDWDFDGAGTSTQQNPSFFFPSPGAHTVSLTASNTSTGSTAMETVTLTQQPSQTESVGSGWDLDGDTLDDVSLIAPNGCGGNATFAIANGSTWSGLGEDYRNVDASDIPADITGTSNFCSTEGVNGLFNGFFVATSGGGVAKVWSPEVSSTSARLEFEVLVGVLPDPPVTDWSFTTYDWIAFFTDESTDGPGSWDWVFGDGNTSSAQNPTHFYAAGDDTYVASLTASNLGGPGATVPMNVTVTMQPSITPSVGGAVDFDGDGTDDLALIAPDGCGGNLTLSPAGGATWAQTGTDYRTTVAPGTISSTSNFCTPEGVSGLFNPTVIQTSIGSIAKFWTPEVDAGGLRMEYELLLLITEPDPPTGVVATPADMSALIDFTAPADDGGTPIIDYTADCGAGNATIVTNDSETIVVSNLTNGVTYTCTVTARNAAGQSAPSESVTVTPVAVADVAISISDDVDPVVAGTALNYTVTVTNNGPDTAENVVVTETLPAGMTFVSTSGCAEDPVGVPTCSLGTIASGNMASFTVSVTVDAGTTGTITNIASVTTSSTDNEPANDSATEDTTVVVEADLSVTKTADSDNVTPGIQTDFVAGEAIHWEIEVENLGPSDATGVVVTDVVPAGLLDVTTTGCLEDPAGLPTCTLGDIAAGGSATIAISATIGPDYADGADLANTASASFNDTDPVGGNNSGSVTVTVNREVDIAFTSTESIDPVVAGSGAGNLTYVVTATNNGPSDASAVVADATVTLPPGVTVDSVTASGSGSATPGLPTTWTIGDLPAGGQETLTFVLTADASAAVGTDTIELSSNLTSVSETETDGSNDTTAQQTSVERQVDLVVTKTDEPDPVLAGIEIGGLEYVVTITNNGPSNADGVVVNDTQAGFPAGVTLDSWVESAGTYDGTNWVVDLPIGATETLTLSVTVGPDTVPGQDVISNTATVTGSGGSETIINPGDDSATETTSVILTTASWAVSKDFLDDSGGAVTATLACTSGTVTTPPVQVSEGSPQVLTVEGFLVSPFGSTSCTVTESNLPADYFQVSASADCEVDGVPHEGDFTCDFVNAPERATFRVTKDFDDDNPAAVSVSLVCNTGLPLMQEAEVSEFGEPFSQIEFVIGDFVPGDLDCDVFEDPVPTGYEQSYVAGDNPDALYASLSSDEAGCHFEGVQTGTFDCAITNTLLPVEVTVNKEWIDENPQFNSPLWVDITLRCANSDIIGAYNCGNDECVDAFIDPDNPGVFGVYPAWDGSSECSVSEQHDASVLAELGDCETLALAPGVGAECTIVNTRLYAGIPTLSQYGLALLALLMLGVGLVSFRRLA